MAKKIYDGQVFGKLTILHDIAGSTTQRRVLCQCECGNTSTPLLADILRGRTRSCGCNTFVNTVTSEELSEQGKRLYKEGKFSHLRLGSERDEYTDFRYILKATKRTSRSAKENTLTLEDVRSKWEEQEGRCAYTNVKLVLPTHTNLRHDVPAYMRASIDRIDSEKGYTAGNIQIVSQTCNYAKNNMTHDEMCEFIRIIRVS